jgi:hypothetical protein
MQKKEAYMAKVLKGNGLFLLGILKKIRKIQDKNGRKNI